MLVCIRWQRSLRANKVKQNKSQKAGGAGGGYLVSGAHAKTVQRPVRQPENV